jgi:hypothetical protein
MQSPSYPIERFRQDHNFKALKPCPSFRLVGETHFVYVSSDEVLYGYETLSLTLKEEHRLRLFENRVLRIFGPRRGEVTGGWRKLHNEELHKLYSSSSIIRKIKSRRMRWAGSVARMRRNGMH